MSISHVVIFSKPSCPFCVKAKDLAEKKNLSYRENIIGEHCTKEEMQECVKAFSPETKANTVPQIFVYRDIPERENSPNMEYIGGCDEFYKYMGES
jgi:glutaredoxin